MKIFHLYKSPFIIPCLWALIGVCVLAYPTDACNVPVFRYALERWPAGAYEVAVLYRDTLTDVQQEIADWLKENSFSEVPHSNFNLRTFDVSELSPDSEPPDIPLDKLPLLHVRYPVDLYGSRPCWTGDLTMENAKALIDSPLRQEIAKRITDGDSAVWILLESGNKEKDEKTAALLEKTLNTLEQTLELPDLDISGLIPVEGDPDSELKAAFSYLRLSKDDPNERLLVEMLLGSETDLRDYLPEPMAFPVYGRGRALYALVGAGINEDNIREACEFITGPCSCLIKDQNPGTDLLIVKDWDAALDEMWVDDASITGEYYNLNAAADSAVADRVNAVTETIALVNETGDGSLQRNIMLAIGVVVLANAVVVWRVFHRRLRASNQ